jgi:23S rRNA pseudouridine1911/1915/1917 synthase
MPDERSRLVNKPTPGDVEVLFSDDSIVVLNKPAGLPVVPQRHNPSPDTLANRLWHHLMQSEGLPEAQARPFVVHRIDRDTSGVVVFARTADMHRHLSRLFETRKITKEYLAVVDGRPDPAEGEIDVPIGPPDGSSHKARGKVFARTRQSRPARTAYELVEAFSGASIVMFRPLTGRRHQIRVHAAEIGCPLFIDPLYGKRRAYPEEKPVMTRLSLHAVRIRFALPSGETRSYEAPLPDDMKSLIALLRWQGLCCRT